MNYWSRIDPGAGGTVQKPGFDTPTFRVHPYYADPQVYH